MGEAGRHLLRPYVAIGFDSGFDSVQRYSRILMPMVLAIILKKAKEVLLFHFIKEKTETQRGDSRSQSC